MGLLRKGTGGKGPGDRLQLAQENDAPKDRLELHEYYLQMLEQVASRSTCRRRKVAAIVTDVRGMVLSMGYNGVPRGITHCLDFPCPGAQDESGDSSRCEAVHAEQNAIIQCADLSRAYTLYCSCTPCFTCAKMIVNSPICLVIAASWYNDEAGHNILERGKVSLYVYGR